ncbi:MAG: hypothetical protein A2040_03705 [Rhodocyclales bacterium GWA2_65_19]|nr:MAG: hypothetical protein A2040_03705 [Rhodocyclales bacterium GWA2_65_19]
MKDCNTKEVWDKFYKRFVIDEFIKNSFATDRWTIHHKSMIDKYLSRLNKNNIFLEAGCGLGQWCYYAANNYGIDAVGVDIAEETMRKMNEYSANSNSKAKVVFICDDLNNTKLDAESADMFISLGVIEHFVDSRPMMRGLFRILKPGGIGLITVPNTYSIHTITRPILQLLNQWEIGYEKSFSPGSLKDLSIGVGFKVIEGGIIPSGEMFGCFLNAIPILGKYIGELSLRIERSQNTFGFISYAIVSKTISSSEYGGPVG